MGWGGKGKGKGIGPHWHHHRHGPGLGVMAAEAAVVGVVAGAAVAAAVARPVPRRPPARPAPVVIVGPTVSATPPVVVAPGPRPYPKGKGKGKGKGPAVVITPEAFAVQSVRIVTEAMENRGDVTFFCIEVWPEGGGAAWRVMRRYSEFHGLHERLGSKSYPDAPFPKKHLFGCSGTKLEDRQNGLQAWLRRTVQDPANRTTWARPLRDFLEAGREFVTIAPTPEDTPLPEASAPDADLAEDLAEGGQVLQVQVPDGVKAGEMIAITVPDGTQLTVEVPQGFSSGADLQLWYEPSSGHLVPMV